MKIVLDIETVRGYKTLEEAPDNFRDAWAYVSKGRWPEEPPAETFIREAALMPEFGKVVAIAAVDSATKQMHSFSLDDLTDPSASEKRLLNSFRQYLFGRAEICSCPVLVGHRIKAFDLPYIITRMAANGITILDCLRQNGKKPWEKSVMDTYELWRGGEHYTTQATSLVSLCLVLGVETPKDDISGAEVGNLFWSDDPNRMARIQSYCEKDVRATGKIFNRLVALKMVAA